VKPLSAILSGLLLVWAQLLAAPAPACGKQPAHAGCHCGGKMSCCSAPSGSQPIPAVPANAGPQRHLSIFAPAIVTMALPESRAGSISSAFVSPLTASGAPLYARDCARLI
jgi:hypothetical protein